METTRRGIWVSPTTLSIQHCTECSHQWNRQQILNVLLDLIFLDFLCIQKCHLQNNKRFLLFLSHICNFWHLSPVSNTTWGLLLTLSLVNGLLRDYPENHVCFLRLKVTQVTEKCKRQRHQTAVSKVQNEQSRGGCLVNHRLHLQG